MEPSYNGDAVSKATRERCSARARMCAGERVRTCRYLHMYAHEHTAQSVSSPLFVLNFCPHLHNSDFVFTEHRLFVMTWVGRLL